MSKTNELQYSFRTDTIFKILFVKHQKLLKKLVSALLDLPESTMAKFEVTDTNMPAEAVGGKACRLDISMEVDGQLINLEIQVENEGNYRERVMFHWAKTYVSALKSGADFELLPKVIIISIIDFKLFDWQEYHSVFKLMESTKHKILSDKMEFHFFELKKVSKELQRTSDLDLWLALFNARTEEDLEKLERLEVNYMAEAIQAYRRILSDEDYIRIGMEMADHDRAQMRTNAMRQGREEGLKLGRAEGRAEGVAQEKLLIAKNLLVKGYDNTEITDITGLTKDEIEKIL